MSLDRSQRQLQHIGDILQLKILIEAEQDNLALNLRQLIERLPNLASVSCLSASSTTDGRSSLRSGGSPKRLRSVW